MAVDEKQEEGARRKRRSPDEMTAAREAAALGGDKGRTEHAIAEIHRIAGEAGLVVPTIERPANQAVESLEEASRALRAAEQALRQLEQDGVDGSALSEAAADIRIYRRFTTRLISRVGAALEGAHA